MCNVIIDGSDGSHREQEYDSLTGAYMAIFQWLYLFSNLHVDWQDIENGDERITLTHPPTKSVVFVIHVIAIEGVGHA